MDAGYTDEEALYASLGYGAVQVLATIPTLFLIDTKGRRKLCLIVSKCLHTTSAYTDNSRHSPACAYSFLPLVCRFSITRAAVPLRLVLSYCESAPFPRSRIAANPFDSFVYLFTICYSLGEGPVAFQYSAEVFPTIQREQGMAWAVCINNTFAGILSLTFPRMRTVMTQTGACKSLSHPHLRLLNTDLVIVGFYAGLNLIAWFLIFCFVRETKQLTLEELDQVFSVPTKNFIGYELKVWLPYFVKRHILRKRIPRPPQIIEKADRVDEQLTA